ncbi:MAG: hypothetical protein P3W97_006855 [Tepidimonas sp.]|uniref:hypothetical protein n=1 Tax=Tepidimonas sp. TaxID=2002775 RepID=UPI00259D61CA|nr:hypothetical protein [Tepidimonas sp.]MDM7456960.1 hypothetical protein [Tepidimonas sp.]
MKAESLPPASSAHGVHRPQGPQGQRGALSDPQGGDPFAQLLADLCADDATGLPATAADTEAAAADTKAAAADTEAGAAAQDDLTTEDDRKPAPRVPTLPETATPLVAAVTPAAIWPPALDSAGSTDGRTQIVAEGQTAPPWAPQAAGVYPVADPAKGAGLGQLQQTSPPDTPPGAWVSTVARSKQRPPGTGLVNGRLVQREASAPDGTAALQTPNTRAGRHAGDAAASAAAAVSSPVEQMAQAQTSDPSSERREAQRPSDALRSGGPATPDTPSRFADGSAGPEVSDFGLQLGQALGEAFESLGAQVSLWTAGKSQRASFSLQEGTDDPLGVDVTVTDGVAQVFFRTDDGAMRQLIQAQAPAALAEALARVGLTLGGVDVGGQFAQGQGQPPADASPRSLRMDLSLTGPAAPSPAGPGVTHQGASGHAGLDVYA